MILDMRPQPLERFQAWRRESGGPQRSSALIFRRPSDVLRQQAATRARTRRTRRARGRRCPKTQTLQTGGGGKNRSIQPSGTPCMMMVLRVYSRHVTARFGCTQKAFTRRRTQVGRWGWLARKAD